MIPPASPVDEPNEAALWVAFAADRRSPAREALFQLHLEFARRIARRHRLRSYAGDIDIEDLRQLASAGLLEAIDRFDPALGSPFKAYAARRITGSVLDGVAKLNEVRQQISFRNRVRRERAHSLSQAHEDQPPADPLQAFTDIAVGLAIGFMLDASGQRQGDEQADPAANAYESLAWKDMLRQVMAEMTRLPDREQRLMRYHYIDGLDFDQIAALFGLSKGRISQLHRSGLATLRKRLKNTHDFRLQR